MIATHSEDGQVSIVGFVTDGTKLFCVYVKADGTIDFAQNTEFTDVQGLP